MPRGKKTDETDQFFNELEEYVKIAALKWPLKVQIERDRRGLPLFGVRVKETGVEPQMMKTLRYPQ